MILDIGCGVNPMGDINTDIEITPCVDCICNAEHLPFKDESFDEVFSRYVVEHCLSPVNMIRETIRVTSKKVTIITNDIHFPGYFLHYILRKGFLVRKAKHLYGWTEHYIRNLMEAMGIERVNISKTIECRKRLRKHIPYRFFYWLIIKPLGLFWKPDIKLEIYK